MGEATASPTAPARRRLRVTFVALNYAPSVGGAQELIRRLAEGLAAHGHDVEVLTTDALRSPTGSDPGVGLPPTDRIGGVAVRRHRVPDAIRQAQRRIRWIVSRRPWRPAAQRDAMMNPWFAGPLSPSLWRSIRGAVRERDVVVGVAAPYLTMLLPPSVRTRRRARVVAMPLLHASHGPPHRLIRRALRRADATVAATAFERDLHAGIGVPSERIGVLSPGIDPDEFAALDAPAARAELGLPERLTVGYVGRLAAYKGIDTLLDAAPLLWADHPELTVLLAGSRVGWDGYRTHPSVALGGDRLVLREDFADGERAALLAACDVVVFASRDESYGMAIVEAWAARRPVVAADIPAVREVMGEAGAGQLVPLDDPAALAASVASLLDDPARAQAIGVAQRRRVEDELGWPAVIDGWEDFLAGVLDRSPRRARASAVAAGRPVAPSAGTA